MARTSDGTLVTQYANLKGVDFTQNPSAVYAKHSPTAINMISDEGGNPKKRTGWEHRVYAENVTLNGKDGWEFQNFWSFEYNNEAHLVCHLSNGTSYRMARLDASNDTMIDLGECSADVVGFYVGTNTSNTFCIMDNGKVYTYVYGEDYAFEEIAPYVPRIIIGQPFEGGGTIYEGVNLLSRRVEESFLGKSDKAESTITLTRNIGDGLVTIRIAHEGNVISKYLWYRRNNGVWQKAYSNEEEYDLVTGWESSSATSSGNIIVIDEDTYKPVVTGEDNVFVTYNMEGTSATAEAFKECYISTLYENRVFLTGAKGLYKNYVWWSAYSDPSYFPDLNYSVIGSNESSVLGLVDVGEYLGVVKSATAVSTTVYFMYSTTFDNDSTYACRQFTNGVGAVSPNTFASVSSEQLYLGRDGIYGINAEHVKNRSYYVNKKLCAEDGLEDAVATVWNGYYILCVNKRCYILDTRQKTGWGTEWTNYSLEAYYWENVDALKFTTFNNDLWFIDYDHNLCRFKNSDERHCYVDGNFIQRHDILGRPLWIVDGEEIPSTQQDEDGNWLRPTKEVVIDTIVNEDGTTTDIYDTQEVGTEAWDMSSEARPEAIYCEWTTPLDADGAPQLFKTLQKKGSLASIVPHESTSAKLYLDIDGTNEVYIGEQRADRFIFSNIEFESFTFNSSSTPIDIYIKKKVKKYKRLQIKIVNDKLDEPLTIQSIVKTYTVKGYSKKLPQDGQFTKEI